MRSAFTARRAFVCSFLLGLSAFAALPVAAAEARTELSQVRTVYLLPMSSGLDQYIANHLSRVGRFQVVTDPQIADAILTERIGEGFEARFDQLYPVPASTDSSDDLGTANRSRSDEERQVRMSSFNRARGNMFLVDRRTRAVIWSHFKRGRNNQPDELDRLGEYFAAQLNKRAGKYQFTPAPAVVPAAPAHVQPEPPPAPAEKTETPAPPAPAATQPK